MKTSNILKLATQGAFFSTNKEDMTIVTGYDFTEELIILSNGAGIPESVWPDLYYTLDGGETWENLVKDESTSGN